MIDIQATIAPIPSSGFRPALFLTTNHYPLTTAFPSPTHSMIRLFNTANSASSADSAASPLPRRLTSRLMATGYWLAVSHCLSGTGDGGGKMRDSDFIHFKTQKMNITPLTSTNMPQNPLRLFAIFLNFCAQSGPISTQNGPPAGSLL